MITILVLVVAFILFDLAALRWGTDSTECITSCEWERRQHGGEQTNELTEVC